MLLGHGAETWRTILLLTLATIATAVIVSLGSVVCGRSSEERAVDDAVNAFVGAIGHDGETACLQLSRDAQAELMRRKDASSCERAAESTARRDVLFLYDFGSIRFVGADDRSAFVPSSFESEDWKDLGVRLVYPRIPLEEGDGRWRITTLDWYFKR